MKLTSAAAQLGRKGGKARAAKYDTATLSRWAKKGGRPRKDFQEHKAEVFDGLRTRILQSITPEDIAKASRAKPWKRKASKKAASQKKVLPSNAKGQGEKRSSAPASEKGRRK